MSRFSERYGELVRRRLAERGWSNREAAARTLGAVSHTLVREIRVHGYVPSTEQVVELALALEDNPNEHLDAAGKPPEIRYVPPGGRGDPESANESGCLRYQTPVHALALAS